MVSWRIAVFVRSDAIKNHAAAAMRSGGSLGTFCPIQSAAVASPPLAARSTQTIVPAGSAAHQLKPDLHREPQLGRQNQLLLLGAESAG